MGTDMKYSRSLLVIVPQSLMSIANQMALIKGESEHDVYTFKDAHWWCNGDRYDVRETVVADEWLAGGLSKEAPTELPSHAAGADVAQAVDAMQRTTFEPTICPETITVLVDVDAHATLAALGLEYGGDTDPAGGKP